MPRRLDLVALKLEAALSELVDTEAAEPLPFDLIAAPTLDLWSVAEGGILVGRDEAGNVVAIECWSLGHDLTWGKTPEGTIRLLRRSRLPIEVG
jgi:hypothetical protein